MVKPDKIRNPLFDRFWINDLISDFIGLNKMLATIKSYFALDLRWLPVNPEDL